MTNFLDGPAKGARLLLRNSPKHLGLVETDGKWEARDLPPDGGRPGETVHHYRLHEVIGSVHVNRGDNGGGIYPMADYMYVE